MMHDFELHEFFHSPKNVLLKVPLFFDLTYFESLGQKSKNDFDLFLVQKKICFWNLLTFMCMPCQPAHDLAVL